MAQADSLKRLGGGRWETKDGRFQIEPQSGTWVIVDTTQTNEFGLPLVRGPYPSLGAAREAIDAARDEGPATSPLAGRIEKAKGEPGRGAPSSGGSKSRVRVAGKDGADDAAAADAEAAGAADAEEPEPEPPPEPAWLRGLKPIGRQKARTLIVRLEALGIEDADAIARAEVADGEPALVRLALERRIREAAGSKRSPTTAVRAAIDVILSGQDDELGVGWSLVDDRGRRIEELDVES